MNLDNKKKNLVYIPLEIEVVDVLMEKGYAATASGDISPDNMGVKDVW